MNKRVVLSIVSTLFLLASALGPTEGKAGAAASRTFPETGKTVTDPFLSYWDSNGGLAQQGYPITEAYQEKNDADGKVYLTQYFERARFEYHPENKDPKFQVLLGLLGAESLSAKYGDNPPTSPTYIVPTHIVPGGGSRTFVETGKTITGLFLEYWNTHGGLEQQGFPITEAYSEKNDADGNTYITQYFERARFEYHPENADPRYKVLLGLVGKEINGRKQGTGGAGDTGGGSMWAGVNLTPPFNAAAVIPVGKYAGAALFFKWPQFVVTSTTDKQGSPPMLVTGTGIQPTWPGLALPSLDAIAVWEEGDKFYGRAHFFSGSKFISYDLGSDMADGTQVLPAGGAQQYGPAPLTDIKTLMPDFPFTSVDAVAVWSGPYVHTAYFFKGTEYARYDARTMKMAAGYPRTITQDFRGLPFSSVDEVVVWPDGKAYFFKGNEYASYDIIAGKTDPGYPKPIK